MAIAKGKLPKGGASGSILPPKRDLEKVKIAMSTKSEGSEFRAIVVNEVKLNPNNLWAKDDDTAEIDQLAEAIRRSGLLHNIVVSEQDDGSYLLLSGERRIRAIRKLLDEEMAADTEGKANYKWHRVQAQVIVGLTPIDEMIILDEANIMVRGVAGETAIMQKCISRYIENLKTRYDLTQAEAEKILRDKSPMPKATLLRYLKIEHDLSPDLGQYMEQGIVSQTQAIALCGLEDKDQGTVTKGIETAIELADSDPVRIKAYTGRVLDRAVQAAKDPKQRKSLLAKLTENLAPQAPAAKDAAAVRTQKSDVIRKYDKFTNDLRKITGSKRRMNNMKKIEIADDDGSIAESLNALITEATKIRDMLSSGKE